MTNEPRDDWYKNLMSRFTHHQDDITPKEYGRFQLDLLLRIARRLHTFSECAECQDFKAKLERFTQDLVGLAHTGGKERKGYFKTLNRIVTHLKRKHKLIREGESFGGWFIIFTGAGIAVGIGLDKLAAGLVIGMAVGFLIGAYAESRAKREGRLI